MEDNCLFIGRSITNVADPLQPISLYDVHKLIADPSPQVINQISQLRIIRCVDASRYALLKRQLQYLVCAKFNPLVRKTGNFAYTRFFMVDIDHIAAKGLDINSLRQQVQNDRRVMMCFLSPGEDGLKLLFRLEQRCFDHGIYSLFYKIFVREFARQYHFQQVVDIKTCDVTRACFLSYDPNAYFNPLADEVCLNHYVNTSQTYDMLDESKKEDTLVTANPINNPAPPADPSQEVIDKIKTILALKKTQTPRPPVFVPEQLNNIMTQLSSALPQYEFRLDEIIDIQYGKKLRVSIGQKHAECNIFYGKRGFTVVVSPKTGTDKELNELFADLLRVLISDIVYGTTQTTT